MAVLRRGVCLLVDFWWPKEPSWALFLKIRFRAGQTEEQCGLIFALRRWGGAHTEQHPYLHARQSGGEPALALVWGRGGGGKMCLTEHPHHFLKVIACLQNQESDIVFLKASSNCSEGHRPPSEVLGALGSFHVSLLSQLGRMGSRILPWFLQTLRPALSG